MARIQISIGQNSRQNTLPNLYASKFPLKRPIETYIVGEKTLHMCEKLEFDAAYIPENLG